MEADPYAWWSYLWLCMDVASFIVYIKCIYMMCILTKIMRVPFPPKLVSYL